MSEQEPIPCYLSEEEYDRLETAPLYVQVRRLEELASVYWPQYNWKLMRSLYTDALIDSVLIIGDLISPDAYEQAMVSWTERLKDFLNHPKREFVSRTIASISSGDYVRQEVELFERLEAGDE